MIRTHRFRRRGFTLLELLVVVSVISLLMALLLPALDKARQQALRVTCATRFQQSSRVIFSYAADHDGHLLPGSEGYGTSYSSPYWIQIDDAHTTVSYDLRPIILDYAATLDFWRCPSVRSGNIGDPWDQGLTALYVNNLYYPGQVYPRFTVGGIDHPSPPTMDEPGLTPAAQTLMSDMAMDRTFYGQGYWFNHARGPFHDWGSGDNTWGTTHTPSLSYRWTSDLADMDGMNILFYDGHVRWHGRDEVVNLGQGRTLAPVNLLGVRP